MTAQPEATRRESFPRRALILLLALALAPVVYTLVRGLLANRNIAYLDDIDGVMMLLIRLEEGGSWSDLFRWLFEVSNEHRMVTSRVLVTLSYWLTGTVDFTIFGVVGNLFLCALCALLIRTAGSTERRWGLAVLLAGLLFQLEHYENFFWSGSSIDHFQVPLLAGGAVVLLARRTALSGLAAATLAMLATFTLAHGLVVWPVGILILAVERRWRHLAGWLLISGVVVGAYFSSFEFNSEHRIEGFSLDRIIQIARYWLELMGAPLALGIRPWARFLGVALVALLTWQIRSGGLRRERIALPLALWAVVSLGLVAVGRANVGDGVLSSRYYVLSGLAWALAIWVALQERRDEARPYRFLVWLVPALVVFNVAANLRFAQPAQRWVSERDNAAADFVKHGRDGVGATALHPLPDHATQVLRQAERLGVFEMPGSPWNAHVRRPSRRSEWPMPSTGSRWTRTR